MLWCHFRPHSPFFAGCRHAGAPVGYLRSSWRAIARLCKLSACSKTPDIEGKLLWLSGSGPAGVQWRTHHVHEAFGSAQRGTPLDLFAQTGLEQFARGGARQCLVDHHGVLGHLELREVSAAVPDDGRQIHLCTIAVDDGANLLTHDLV